MAYEIKFTYTIEGTATFLCDADNAEDAWQTFIDMQHDADIQMSLEEAEDGETIDTWPDEIDKDEALNNSHRTEFKLVNLTEVKNEKH